MIRSLYFYGGNCMSELNVINIFWVYL